jgi:hypothetical protein
MIAVVQAVPRLLDFEDSRVMPSDFRASGQSTQCFVVIIRYGPPLEECRRGERVQSATA